MRRDKGRVNVARSPWHAGLAFAIPGALVLWGLVAHAGQVTNRVRLVRVRFGPIELGDLPKGSWRPLSDKEISSLRDTARATHPKGGNDGSEG